MATAPTTLNTTLGTCTVCHGRRPAGLSALRAGVWIGALGIAAALAGWFLSQPALSGALCAVGVGLGGPLIAWGILRGVRSPEGFAEAELELEDETAAPGATLEGKVTVRPDHPLHLRLLTCELQACEESLAAEGSQHGPRVLRSVELAQEGDLAVHGLFSRPLSVKVPRDWPATMQTPPEVKLPPRRVFTRVRVALDFDAHPLLELAAPLAIAPAAR